jgi:hypothetical protein
VLVQFLGEAFDHGKQPAKLSLLKARLFQGRMGPTNEDVADRRESLPVSLGRLVVHWLFDHEYTALLGKGGKQMLGPLVDEVPA